jgi:hypothetical protein
MQDGVSLGGMIGYTTCLAIPCILARAGYTVVRLGRETAEE